MRGGTYVMHGRRRMIIDPRTPTRAGGSTSDFFRPGRQMSGGIGGDGEKERRRKRGGRREGVHEGEGVMSRGKWWGAKESEICLLL